MFESKKQKGHKKAKNQTNYSLLGWLGILGLGGALAVYLIRNSAISNTSLSNAPIVDSHDSPQLYSDYCNSSFWAPAIKYVAGDYWQFSTQKMVYSVTPQQAQDIQLRQKLLPKFSQRVYQELEELRSLAVCADGHCNYIDQVLTHPSFKIILVKSLAQEGHGGAYDAGFFREEKNAIYLGIDETSPLMDNNGFKRLMLHEFWHAYKTLVHSEGNLPPSYNVTSVNSRGAAFNHRAKDAKSREGSLQSAIDKGDNLVFRFQELLNKEKYPKKSLTRQEQTDLAAYKSAVKSYMPQYQSGAVSAEKFKLFEKALTQTLAKKQVYKYEFNEGPHRLVIYVDSIKKLADGRVSLQGYTTPIMEDKATALINDTRMRKYNLPQTFKKRGYDPFASPKVSLLTEGDAQIMEGGKDVCETFYPDLMKFHRCEHNEYLSSSKPDAKLGK